MTRFVPVAVLLVVLAAGGVAQAQSSLPNGAQIVFEHRQIFEGGKFVEPTAGTTDVLRYFNLAHCNCAQANVGNANSVGWFRYNIHEVPASGLHGPFSLYAGTSCDNAANRPGGSSQTCNLLGAPINDIDATLNATGGAFEAFNLFQVVSANSITPPDTCPTVDGVTNSIYVLIDTQGGSNFNYSASQPAGGAPGDTTTGAIDTKPPPLPTANLKATPNENRIDISWTPPSSNSTDIAGYQALCAIDEPNTPPARAQESAPEYITTQAACPGAVTTIPMNEMPTPTSLNNGEAAVAMPGGAFGTLDAKWICAHTDSGTANSLAITGLENGTAYQVILVSFDRHGNFSATYFDHTITPHLVTDFWEDLHDKGSKADGGLCLLAETYGNDSALTRTLRAFRDDTLGGSRIGRWLGRAYYATLGRLGGLVHGSIVLRWVAGIALAPLVAFALLWHWLGLPIVLGLLAAAWWLRRRRRAAAPRAAIGPSRWRVHRWLGVAATGAIVVLGAERAHAGNGGYQPYWEDTDPTRQSEQNQVPPGDPSLVDWHAGLRIGPYTPDIDNQLNMHPGPFEQMFGTTQHMMTTLDVDRVLWTGFGQVGVGVSVGYWQKTARAFGALPDGTPTTMRDASAHNAMRLVPVALTATYRFTVLDDNYGIPVVPYARAGLGYYVWWISINDHFARVCSDGGIEPNCSQNKALGASLGVQGAIGLAIRAERIDASAAMSMQQSGIQHAGVYAELSLAKIDGFGSDQKLSVGDRTWSAGVDFEF